MLQKIEFLLQILLEEFREYTMDYYLDEKYLIKQFYKINFY